MKTKILALILCAALMVSFVAPLTLSASATETSQPTQPTETTAPSEEPTEASSRTKEPTETSQPTQPTETTAPSKEPTETTAPTKEPTETTAPTVEPDYICDCGKNAESIVDHSIACARRKYIVSLVQDKTAQDISATWSKYTNQEKTDILDLLEATDLERCAELLNLVEAGGTIALVQDTMRSFAEIVNEIPAAEDVSDFVEAHEQFESIYAIAARDTPLPRDEVNKYNQAYRTFAGAIGHDENKVTVSYPGTDLIEELKEKVGVAFDLLDEAEDLFASVSTVDLLLTDEEVQPKSVLDLDDSYAALKAKLDAILLVKPDLFENEVAVVDDEDHTVSTVRENIQMHLFNYGPRINEQQTGQGFMRFIHSEFTYGWAVDSAGDALAEASGGWASLDTLLTAQKLFPYINKSQGGEAIKTGTTQYLFDPNYTTGRVTYEQYKNNISSRGSENSTPYQYHSIYFPINNTDGSGTGLFQKEGSYYVYDSAKNAAWYNPETQKFEIYNYVLRPAYTVYGEATANGNFLPFNKGHVQGRQDYQTNTIKKELTEANGTKHEAIVAVGANNPTKPNNASVTAYRLWGNSSDTEVDLWFGLDFEFDFNQPKGGIRDNQPMVFEFLGDDDVFVYVDNVLILDIGGTHGSQAGSINFATGAVENPLNYGQYGTDVAKKSSTIYALMKAALGDKLDESQFIDSNGDGYKDTFKDYTTHNLKFYYLERGGNISYCKLKFNMDPLPIGSVSLQKQVDGINDAIKDNQTYSFTVTATDANGNAVNDIKYQLSTEGVTDSNVYTVNNTGTISLKANQMASFTNLKAGTKVTFTEADNAATKELQWALNGQKQEGASLTATVAEGNASAKFICTNTRKTGTLTVEKILTGDKYETNDSYEITVTIDGKPYTGSAVTNDNKTVTFTNGKTSLKAGQKITISSIPSGMDYTVVETKPSDDPAYAYDEPVYVNERGSIVADQTAEVTITNTLHLLYGDLLITKTGIDNRDHSADPNGPYGEQQSTVYQITGTSNSGIELDMRVVIVGNSSKCIKNVPAGNYTVTELTDWSWRYTNTNNSANVTISGGQTTSTTFNNTRTQHLWLSGDNYCKNLWVNASSDAATN